MVAAATGIGFGTVRLARTGGDWVMSKTATPAAVPPHSGPQFIMKALEPSALKTPQTGLSNPLTVQAATGAAEHGTWVLVCPPVPSKAGNSSVTESELSEKIRIWLPV